MKIAYQSADMVFVNSEHFWGISPEDVNIFIERCGRVCYKSESQATDESSKKFVQNLIKNGHESVLEHVNVSLKIRTDRGVSHELVRHRLASYSQESTRYCNYSLGKFDSELTFIEPIFKSGDADGDKRETWCHMMRECEENYIKMLASGCTPQEARSILPNSLKTELIMTTNIREWRHFLKVRALEETGSVHPMMLELAEIILLEMHSNFPDLFEDLYKKRIEMDGGELFENRIRGRRGRRIL